MSQTIIKQYRNTLIFYLVKLFKTRTSLVLPHNDMIHLCYGFIVLDTNDNICEYHCCPIYSTPQQCLEIEHPTIEHWRNTKIHLSHLKQNKLHNHDDPKQMKLGFVAYPSNIWHTFSFENNN